MKRLEKANFLAFGGESKSGTLSQSDGELGEEVLSEYEHRVRSMSLET